ncbi:hypothetical protein H9P43_000743 [Blastocladiella emersonii ATCC 22665]|nr:hypothetical protein H9P43_000743 [Blastocladiella emersonii ATCC 22665]
MTFGKVPVTSYAATLQSINTDLVKSVEALRRDLRHLTSSIDRAEERKGHLQAQIAELQGELHATDASLQSMHAARERIEASLSQSERTYQQIVQSSQQLLDQLQRDADAFSPPPPHHD